MVLQTATKQKREGASALEHPLCFFPPLPPAQVQAHTATTPPPAPCHHLRAHSSWGKKPALPFRPSPPPALPAAHGEAAASLPTPAAPCRQRVALFPSNFPQGESISGLSRLPSAPSGSQLGE